MKKYKVGRIFYLSMHNKDLVRFWNCVKAEDVARYLELKGKVELIEEDGQLYYVVNKGVDISRRGIRQILIEELKKDLELVLDKKMLKLVQKLCRCFSTDIEDIA